MMSNIENSGLEEHDSSEQATAELLRPTADATAAAVGQNAQVRAYVRASKAENTLRGYQSDWRDFCVWCGVHDACPMPAAAETVAAYIADCAGHLKPGSIQRRLNAIAEAHKAAGPPIALSARTG
jgi:hypothetical protein